MKSLPIFAAPVDATERLEVRSFVDDDGTVRIELWQVQHDCGTPAANVPETLVHTLSGSTAVHLAQALWDATRVAGARRAVVMHGIQDAARRKVVKS